MQCKKWSVSIVARWNYSWSKEGPCVVRRVPGDPLLLNSTEFERLLGNGFERGCLGNTAYCAFKSDEKTVSGDPSHPSIG